MTRRVTVAVAVQWVTQSRLLVLFPWWVEPVDEAGDFLGVVGRMSFVLTV